MVVLLYFYGIVLFCYCVVLSMVVLLYFHVIVLLYLYSASKPPSWVLMLPSSLYVEESRAVVSPPALTQTLNCASNSLDGGVVNDTDLFSRYTLYSYDPQSGAAL